MLTFTIDIFESIGYQTILDLILLTLLTIFILAFCLLRYINTREDSKRERLVSKLEADWKHYMTEYH